MKRGPPNAGVTCGPEVSTHATHKQLLIGSLPPPVGGTTVLLAQLVDYLTHRPDFVLEICDTSLKDGGRGRFSAAYAAVWACIARAPKGDSVAYHGSLNGLLIVSPILAVICRVFRKRFLVRIFGGNLDAALVEWPALLTFGFRRLVLRWSVVLCETKKGTELLRRLGGRRVVWYPNSRPMTLRVPELIFTAGEPIRLAFVGHVRHDKGVVELVEAIRRLNGEADLDIYGPIFDDVREDSLTTRHSVYRGSVDPATVPELLKRYHALILPTYYPGEGYPGVILEAYAVGVPVITTNWQCIPEIVSEDSGILVPPRDVAALVEAIRTMHSGERYSRFRVGAIEKAAFFDAQRWSDLYVELSTGRYGHEESGMLGGIAAS